MNEKIVIFGCGTTSYVAYHTCIHDNHVDVSGFTVDRDYLPGDSYLGHPVVAFDELENRFPPSEFKLLIGLGYLKTNKLRAWKYEEAREKGYTLFNLINKRTYTYPDLVIGDNCFIGANVVIHPGVTIGNNVVIRDNCFIGHHTVIKDHCFIGAGSVVSGSTMIEEYCLLGVNSTIRDSIKIARSSIIGAGVTVLKDTREKEVLIANQGQVFPFSSDEL